MGQPFKLTFKLKSPVCLTFPFIHLDGLLSHIALRRDHQDFRCLPSKYPIEFDYKEIIPLDFDSKYGVFKGSASWFKLCEGVKFRTVKIYKRFYDQGLNVDKVKSKKIDVSRGFFRSHAIPLMYLPATECVFWGCGDIEAVRDLADAVAGIGKKIHIGFGLVKETIIEECDEDWSIFREIDGRKKAMRAIPIDKLEWADTKATLAYKPPYWVRENHTVCAFPGSEIR